MAKTIKYLCILLLSVTLTACGELDSKNNPDLQTWTQVVNSCGPNLVDDVVLSCLNADWIRTKDDFHALDVLLSDCIGEGLLNETSLQYRLNLSSMNNFEFTYNNETCLNQYQR